MPLTLEELQELQADAMADDIDIDLEKMSLWTKDQATTYFESGGTEEPKEAKAAPPLPPAPAEDFKKWFPKYKKLPSPKMRLVCFHNAGSAESVYTTRGVRQTAEAPFVAASEKGIELLACELPGREQRRNETRFTQLQPAAKALYPILAPVLQEPVPYVLVGHSMGTWMLYEFMCLLVAEGIPLPKQIVVSSFPGPSIPLADRPWTPQKTLADPAFMDECRGWDVNEIVFQGSNWKTFGAMMRDDFTLFDEYAMGIKEKFDVPIRAFYAESDKKVKKSHVELWRGFTSEKFLGPEVVPGNHLFFYQYPVRNAWMDSVIQGLPL